MHHIHIHAYMHSTHLGLFRCKRLRAGEMPGLGQGGRRIGGVMGVLFANAGLLFAVRLLPSAAAVPRADLPSLTWRQPAARAGPRVAASCEARRLPQLRAPRRWRRRRPSPSAHRCPQHSTPRRSCRLARACCWELLLLRDRVVARYSAGGVGSVAPERRCI